MKKKQNQDARLTLDWVLVTLYALYVEKTLEGAQEANEAISIQKVVSAKLCAERRALVRRGIAKQQFLNIAAALHSGAILLRALNALESAADFADWQASVKPVLVAAGFAV